MKNVNWQLMPADCITYARVKVKADTLSAKNQRQHYKDQCKSAKCKWNLQNSTMVHCFLKSMQYALSTCCSKTLYAAYIWKEEERKRVMSWVLTA